jgi:hypothetical protein
MPRFRTRRVSASVAIVSGAALLILFVSVALANRIGTETASGDFATAVTSGSVDHPSVIRVKITATPRQVVDGNWDVVCSRGTGAGTKSGTFRGRSTLVRRMRLPMSHPDSCTAGAAASLSHGGKLRVTILSP